VNGQESHLPISGLRKSIAATSRPSGAKGVIQFPFLTESELLGALHGLETISFMEYVERHHRPPETLLAPNKTLVRLKGLMSLAAVGRCLADIDFLGGEGDNAGFIWIDDDGISAQVVKIDPGLAFNFSDSRNFILAQETKRHFKPPPKTKSIFFIGTLSPSLKEKSFLRLCLNCSRYLHSKGVFHFLFHREGKLKFNEIELILPEFTPETGNRYEKLADKKLKHLLLRFNGF